LLGARMVMLLPVLELHQDAPARGPQFTNWRTLWNWLRSLPTRSETHVRHLFSLAWDPTSKHWQARAYWA